MLGRLGTIMSLVGQHVQQQIRGMSTLKSISAHLKTVKNIQKFTKSMKLVSAAKYSRAEKELRDARPYGEGTQVFFEMAEVTPIGEAPKRLLIAMTSDKGLSGSLHSQVTRYIQSELAVNPENTMVICVGEKSRSLLQRSHANHIILVASEIGKKTATFLDASKLAIFILNSEYAFQSGKIVYNKFRSVASYATSDLPIFNVEAISAAPNLSAYDSLDDQTLQSYLEFSLASLLYLAMKEGAVSEQSARMTAMDHATNNAGKLIKQLALTVNRTRQGIVTRDLIEIISGASHHH